MPAPHTAAARRPSGTGPAAWRSPLGLVVLAGVLYAVLALVFVGLDRQLRWDEVTYLAQVTPGQPDVWFGPQRARGMTIVLLPVAVLGAPTGLLRAYLIAVHAVALVLAYRPWAHVAGWTAGAAALVTAVGWVPLYFAVEGYPNLLAAFAAVAAAGHTVRWCLGRTGRAGPGGRVDASGAPVDAGGGRADAGGGRGDPRGHRDLVAAALAIAVVAWLRPTESVWIAGALTPVVLVLAWRGRSGQGAQAAARRGQGSPPSARVGRGSASMWRAVWGSAWRPIAAFAAGGFVGWLPWLVEAIARFGGPFARLEAARSASASGEPRNSLIQYLNLVEGPVRRVVEDPVLTGPALLLLTGLLVLALLGALQRVDDTRRATAAVGAFTAAVMVAPYLVLNAGINLRYLLPGLLLGALPVGAGLVTLASGLRRQRSWVGAIVLVALLGTAAGWQAHLARLNSDAIAPLQARPVPLGQALADAAGGEACAFLSNVQWPEIQWHSGCLGEVLDPDNALLQCHDARRDMAALADEGVRIFVLRRGEPPFSPSVEGWPVRQLDEPEGGVWRLYERPTTLGSGDPPSVPDPADSTTPCPPSRAPDTSDASLQLRWSRP